MIRINCLRTKYIIVVDSKYSSFLLPVNFKKVLIILIYYNYICTVNHFCIYF